MKKPQKLRGKIIKCSHGQMWYANKIGMKYLVKESNAYPDYYKAIYGEGFIDKKDIEITEVNDVYVKKNLHTITTQINHFS